MGPENAPYFFNSTTGESTWDRPADLESDSDSPCESDSEPTTNVTGALGTGSCNDGTKLLHCSGHSSPASHAKPVQALSGATLNSEEWNADIRERDTQSKEDSLDNQGCLPVKARTAAESEDSSRLSVDVEKEKAADKNCGMGPRGRGRPRGRGGKGRGAGGKRKDSRDSSLVGETGGGVLAGGSNCKTPSVRGDSRGHNAALRKESLQTEAVTGCFREEKAFEAHAHAAVLDGPASVIEISSNVPARALTDPAVDAILSSVAEGLHSCHAAPSAPADGAAVSEKSSTAVAKADEKREVAVLEEEVEAEPKRGA